MPQSRNTPATLRMGRAQFAAFEPSISSLYTSRQLRGLLTLGLLFNHEVVISDTQLGDNPHLVGDYLSRRDTGLLSFVKKLIALGLIRVSLRDKFVYGGGEKEIEVHSFSDVYSGWLRQAMPGAWVVRDQSNHRKNYYSEIDKILKPKHLIQYNYRDLKQSFMYRVREWANFTNNLEQIPSVKLNAYKSLLARDWFSHSDIYSVLSQDYTGDSDIGVQIHGIIDQTCYANCCTVDLLGCHISPMHSTLQFDSYLDTQVEHPLSVVTDTLLEEMELPALSALALLRPEEIIELQRKGMHVFQLIDLSLIGKRDNLSRLRQQIASSLVEYWNIISDFLASRYPNVAHERTYLGLLAGKYPRLSNASKGIIPFLSVLGTCFIQDDNLRNFHQDYIRLLMQNFSFSFLTHRESGTMKSLRHALPDTNWVYSLLNERLQTS